MTLPPPPPPPKPIPYAAFSPSVPEFWSVIRWVIAGWACAVILRHGFYYTQLMVGVNYANPTITAIGSVLEVAALVVVLIGCVAHADGRRVVWVGSILFICAACVSCIIAVSLMISRADLPVRGLLRPGWQIATLLTAVVPAVMALVLTSRKRV